MKRRRLRGVLANFLSGLTSRYSDVDGYWLFGLLARDVDALELDLVGPAPSEAGPTLRATFDIARQRLQQQWASAGLTPPAFSAVVLSMTKRTAPGGFVISLTVVAETRDGRVVQAGREVFARPHDPTRESRSLRAGG